MTAKASSALLLIIEKQHASWELMGTASRLTCRGAWFMGSLLGSQRSRRPTLQNGFLRRRFCCLSHCRSDFLHGAEGFIVRVSQ